MIFLLFSGRLGPSGPFDVFMDFLLLWLKNLRIPEFHNKNNLRVGTNEEVQISHKCKFYRQVYNCAK